MTDGAPYAQWLPDEVRAVGRRLQASADDVAEVAGSVVADIGGPLWAGPPGWRGVSSRVAEATLTGVVRRVRSLGALLDDFAAATLEATAIDGPVADLRALLAATAAVDRELIVDPLGLGRRLLGWVTALRVEGAVAAVVVADRRCAAALADVTATARALLRDWRPADLRALLAAEGLDIALPAEGADPSLVADWWATRSPAERLSLLIDSAQALGSLAGLPASVRDAANRLVMQRFLASSGERRRALVLDLLRAVSQGRASDALGLVRRVDELDRRQRFFATVAADVAAYDGGTDASGAGVPVQVLLADPDAFGDHGRAAVAFGDVDTAAHVAYVVPGFRQRVVPEMWRTTGDAWRVRVAAGSATASIAWLGYDVPTAADVAGDADARAGGDRLAADIGGVRAARAGNEPHVSVVAHSYGSTTAGVMLREHPRVRVDDLVVVGSPGLGVATAAELPLDPAHVWVGASGGDIVDHLGRFGADPAGASFGGRRFDAQSAQRSWWDPFEEHSHYFDDGSPSLVNIAAIVDGHPGDVTVAPPRPGDPWWPSLSP